jgi:hypothetical protein
LQELEENPFLELQKEFSSYYKIDKFVRNDPSFKYIEPEEHKIKILPAADSDHPKEGNFVYISVAETLANITADPGFQSEKQQEDGLLRDVKDGHVYKSNPFFTEHPEAYTLMLYSDAVELNNPLGAKKGVYKLVNIYWTFAEIPKYLRSRTENWFLALSVKESDLKLSRDAIYKPLLEDLVNLENGILLSSGETLRAGLLCHIGDNLESHLVGGFSTCFSSRDICRICHCQYSDLPTLTGIPTAPAWTAEEYDSILKGDLEERCGLKDKCVFNVLKSFHAVGQFPMDPLHDFYEKIAACDAQSIMVSLTATGKVVLESYNSLLSNLSLEDYESRDRPLPVSLKAEKLGGKALSVALHLRVMPFLLSRLVDEDLESELIDLLFILSKLNEYVLADSFSVADVIEFQELVVTYFEKRQECMEQYPAFKKNTPKMHYLEHYSQQIVDFGPFTTTWTARGESRHRDFVNFSESSKNFINILKTLAIKNQKKMACRVYSGFFSLPQIQFPGKKLTPAEQSGSLPAEFFKRGDVLTDKIIVKNTKYRVGHLVVTSVESENVLEVGCILQIVVRHREVLFLVTRYECGRTRFRYFDAHPLDVCLVKYSSLRDYKPLIRRGAEECPRFLLHHHLPTMPGAE